MFPTSTQLIGARAMVRWSRPQLAEASGISRATIADIEGGQRKRPGVQTISALVQALQDQGVEFGDDGWVRKRHEE